MSEPFDSREVVFEGVTFRIRKMMPMDAKRIFMTHVRPLLRGALAANVSDNATTTGWSMLLAAFTDAPQQHYDAIVQALYRQITYQESGDSQPKVLLRDEENAFRNLNMAHSLILDVRAFYVNFFESLGVMTSEFPALGQALQSLTRETSTPSSETRSTQDSAV